LVTVAVFRKPEWTRELSMEVTSYAASSDGSCSGTVVERHRSSESITVPLGEFTTFDVELAARDDDHDGYILEAPDVVGTDCADKDVNIHPGLPEVCGGTVDTDCDDDAGCADAECLDAACDDHNPCTENDQCRPGTEPKPTCAGTPKTCTPPNLTCYTNESACNPATGECVHTQKPPTESCDDNDACTASDQCGATASCRGTPSVQCDDPPNMVCYESAGVCNAATGECSYIPKGSTATCDDANACTQNDRCNGAGACAGELTMDCVPGDACHVSSRNCPGDATCVETVDTTAVNRPCTTPTRNGVCRVDGVCSGFPYIPSNFDPDSIAEADRGLDVIINCGSVPATFDSGTLTWTPAGGCTFPTMPTAVVQGDYAVVPIRNLTIEVTRALKITGSRPVILAVYGTATLSGDLLADADMETPGPGGNHANCGGQKGGNGTFSNGEGSGGGGGGFGTAGAQGGPNYSGAAGGAAGVVGATSLAPLVGGCAGGNGGSGNGGAGGGGGGALQVAVAGTLHVDHIISVSGGGARGGRRTTGNSGGGGGGGSGGGLLLEAFRLELTNNARITANGGSGAEGADSGGNTGSDGVDGSLSTKAPAECPDVGGTGAPGGDGGADGAAPTSSNNGQNNAGGGGGGGSVGLIRMRGFGTCGIDASCNATDNTGCEISPRVTATCG
jgi:hypothetical protein